MLKLPLLEFFTRAVPESFLIVFAVHIFSKSVIDKKKYLLSSVLMALIAFIVRTLPIHYGVHTILSLIGLIVLTVSINKIDIIKSIQAVIITVIIEFTCEGINIFIIQYVLKVNMDSVFNNPVLKTVYGIPSLIILGCIIALVYFRILKRQEMGQVTNGEIEL